MLKKTLENFDSKYIQISNSNKNVKLDCGTDFPYQELRNIQLLRAVIELPVTHQSAAARAVYFVKDDEPVYLIDVIKGAASDNKVYLDVTDELQDTFNSGGSYAEILIEGDSSNYYTFNSDLIKLHLEYNYKNDENLDSAFIATNKTLAGNGAVNLATGQLNFGVKDVVVGNSALPITISHHYNQSLAGKNEYNCGKGWKLNCQQYLKRTELDFSTNGESNTSYIWTDAEGKDVAFYEKYYYLDGDKKRKYVSALEVQLNADGSFSLADGTALEKECVSDCGCILQAEPINIKNKELFYTSTEQIYSLEQRLKSINDTLDQLAENKKLAYKSYVNSLNNSIAQIKKLFQDVDWEMLQNGLNARLETAKSEGAVYGEQGTRLNNAIVNLKERAEAFNSIYLNPDNSENYLKGEIAEIKEKIRVLRINFQDLYVFVTTIIDIVYAWYFQADETIKTLKYPFSLATDSFISTFEQYNAQSENLAKQKEEYQTLKYQCEEQLKYYRQNQPTCFIKDGDLFYGFADWKDGVMRLILTIDKYDNYIFYTYDKDNKLLRIDSSSGDSVTLEYEKELLSYIVDSNGTKVNYKYTNDNLTDINSNSYYYNEGGLLVGAMNIDDIIGVGLEYTGNRVAKLYGLQRYKSITANNSVTFKSGEIAEGDKAQFSTTLKKYRPVSINYYDYKTVIVTDEFSGKAKTYIFDNSGKLQAQYDNGYDGKVFNEKTKGVTYQRNGNNLCFEATQAEWAEELAVDEYDLSGFSSVSGSVNEFRTNNETPSTNKSVTQTLSNEIIEKIKEQKMDCLVLSGWAKADSPWIKTVNKVNYIEDSASDRLTDLVLSNNDGRENRRFELRIELTYGTSTKICYTSFDWMNNEWQYCAVPVKLQDVVRNNLKGIKLIFDYSNNYGEAQFFGMSFKEGLWSESKFYDDGKLCEQSNSSTAFTGVYFYDKNNNLSQIAKLVELPGEDSEVDFGTKFYNNANDSLSKVIDPDGMVTEYVYDDKGNVVKEMVYHRDEPANKFITETIINEDGSQTESVNALGGKTTACFDKKGNLTEQTDPIGNKASFGYEDRFGGLANITATVNGETSSNENVYKNGLLVKTKHNGCEYEFEYDGEGRKTAVKIGGETYCTITYDSKDIQTVTYANNERIQTHRLKDGNTYKIYSAPVGEKITDSIVVQYDKAGVDSERDKHSYKEYIEDRTNDGKDVKYKTYYDKKGRVAKTEISGGNYGDKLLINNTYGFENALLEQRIQIGNNDPVDEIKRTYEYGYTNKLKTIEHVEEVNKGQVTVFTETPVLDKLGRVFSIDKGNVSKRFNYVQNGERATTLVASETFGEQGQKADKLSYTYDKQGNIVEIRENGELINRYKYDSLNRLVREDNRALNKSTFFTYDSAGNITQRKESAFTLGLTDTVEKTVAGTYVYADNGVMDRLLSYNGENIVYNELGNPTTYRNKELTWSFINRLASFGDISFKYNYAGIRIFKTVGDKTTKYYCDGAKVIAQDDGTDMLYFYYGTEGVTGFKYNGQVYHYKKDMLGNILGIYDANGQLISKYVYDAWGNHKTFVLENGVYIDISDRTAYTNSDDISTKLAILNPFRYRSYYFDIETGLYYLQSRYYDPETGRFISMDSIEYLDPETIHGLNLYAYCANNPVMCVDPSGNTAWWQWLLSGLATVGGAVLCFVPGGQGFGVALLVSGASMLTSNIMSAVGIDSKSASLISSALNIVAGIALCFTPFAGLGASMIGSGIGGIAGGYISEALGGSFAFGAGLGSIVGGIIGSKIYDGIKIAQLAKSGAVVIGEGMDRVRETASSIGASTYSGMPGFKTLSKIFPGKFMNQLGLAHNARWIRWVAKSGVDIVDIGIVFGRNSPNYLMEILYIGKWLF